MNVIGNMTAFSQYAIQVVMAFMMLIMIFIILPRTIVSGNRIYEVLKTKPSIIDGNQAKNLEKQMVKLNLEMFLFHIIKIPCLLLVIFHLK